VIAIVPGATGVVRAQGEYAIAASNAVAIAPTGVGAAHAATIPLYVSGVAVPVDGAWMARSG
jgi:hypothetical protein